MKKLIYTLAAAITVFASCEKEIDLDYHEIDPLPVIEGILTSDKTEVKFTRTRNMTDSVKAPGIKCESVRIIADDGTATELEFNSDGFYRPTSNIQVLPGHKYTLEVKNDGLTYTAVSTVNEPVVTTEPEFIWAELMDWMQCWQFKIIDNPDTVEKYVRVDVWRNGKIYAWGTISGKGEFPCTMSLYYDSDMEMDEEMIVYNGDKMRLEIMTIDYETYNYLYGLQIDNMNPSPIFKCSNPDVTCLGYFSAMKNIQVYETEYVKTEHPK